MQIFLPPEVPNMLKVKEKENLSIREANEE